MQRIESGPVELGGQIQSNFKFLIHLQFQFSLPSGGSRLGQAFAWPSEALQRIQSNSCPRWGALLLPFHGVKRATLPISPVALLSLSLSLFDFFLFFLLGHLLWFRFAHEFCAVRDRNFCLKGSSLMQTRWPLSSVSCFARAGNFARANCSLSSRSASAFNGKKSSWWAKQVIVVVIIWPAADGLKFARALARIKATRVQVFFLLSRSSFFSRGPTRVLWTRKHSSGVASRI